MSESAFAELERCSFLAAGQAESTSTTDSARQGFCTASGAPREVRSSEQRDRCMTFSHTACPFLVAALRSNADPAWRALERRVQGVADSCYLAQVSLELCSERLEPVLEEIFGPTS